MANRQKYVFRRPKTEAEAIMRRNEAIARLNDVAEEISLLIAERTDLKQEIELLNKGMRFDNHQSVGAVRAG